MADRIEDYAIVGDMQSVARRTTGVDHEMSAEACQAKSIQTARL
jgi:hypothetical protein